MDEQALKIGIANMALLKLGQPSIMSLTDKSVKAMRVAQEIDAAIETVLRAYPWPFAMSRKQLQRVADKTPAFQYAYYYEMPTDIIRLVEVFNNGNNYEIENRYMATSAEDVYIKYISKDEALRALDVQTRDVMATNLALRLSIITTENPQITQMLEQQYELQLAEARSVWAFESMPQTVIEGNWLPSRVASPTAELRGDFNPWGADGTGISGGEPRGPGVFTFTQHPGK